jgi:hypothetical protein
MQPMRASRIVGGMLGIALLGACAPDYSAVRDWSAQARETLLPPASVRPAIGLAISPAPPAVVTVEGRQGAVRALQEAAAAWLAVVAYVAEDGLPRGRTNSFGQLAERVLPFDAEGAVAVTELGEAVAFGARRNWRAPQLGVAVDYGDASFQRVMAALARQIEELERELPGQTAAAEARHEAIARIAEGHALLKGNQGRLSGAETARVLRLQESELRRLMVLGGRYSGLRSGLNAKPL